jgi:hypothetical protein
MTGKSDESLMQNRAFPEFKVLLCGYAVSDITNKSPKDRGKNQTVGLADIIIQRKKIF